MTITIVVPQGKSPICQVWWSLAISSGNLMTLVCQVISKNCVIKGSCDFMDRSYQVWWPMAFWYYRCNGFVCHMTLPDHMIKVFIWLYGYEPLNIYHHLTKFPDHRHCVSGNNKSFRLSRDLERPCDQSLIWLYGQDSLKASEW